MGARLLQASGRRVRILVLNTLAPFQRGGAELAAEELTRQLTAAGHDADLMSVLFDYETPASVLASLATARLLEIPDADLVIGLRFPAYLVPHPNKTIWLVHQFRQVYDSWNLPGGWYPTPATERMRRLVRDADRQAFQEARQLFAISRVVGERLHRSLSMEAKVLEAPPLRDVAPEPPAYRRHIVALGRICESKRQHLILQALELTTSDWTLEILGPSEPRDDYLKRLRSLAEGSPKLRGRVKITSSFVPTSEITQRVQTASCVFYAPTDEDSYGYVTLESGLACRPVLTTTDSGGVLDLISNGKNGMVTRPTPDAIAEALDRASLDELARMGSTARSVAEARDLSWHRVVRELTQ